MLLSLKKPQALTTLKETKDVTVLSVYKFLETAIGMFLSRNDCFPLEDLLSTVLLFITLKSWFQTHVSNIDVFGFSLFGFWWGFLFLGF